MSPRGAHSQWAWRTRLQAIAISHGHRQDATDGQVMSIGENSHKQLVDLTHKISFEKGTRQGVL
jgi:hypothetical protein